MFALLNGLRFGLVELQMGFWDVAFLSYQASFTLEFLQIVLLLYDVYISSGFFLNHCQKYNLFLYLVNLFWCFFFI